MKPSNLRGVRGGRGESLGKEEGGIFDGEGRGGEVPDSLGDYVEVVLRVVLVFGRGMGDGGWGMGD